MELDAASVGCANGHSFDLSRHGYVTLLDKPNRQAVETAGMVAARAQFQSEGHYGVLARAVVDTVRRDLAPDRTATVVDVGAGTGYYLRAVLDALPDAAGIAVDLSKYAARRAAKAHERAVAVVADVWQRLPIDDQVADVVLDIFSPRNAREFRRILTPDGTLLVVTPTADHMRELVEPLALVRVDEEKDDRLARTLDPWFTQLSEERIEHPLALSRAQVLAMVEMGPSAWHGRREERQRTLDAMPEPCAVTASFTLRRYRPGKRYRPGNS